MILIIKTKGMKSCLGIAKKEELTDQHFWESGKNLSKELLSEIKIFLDKNNIQFTDLSGIIVYLGPGSFTSLRIGVTVANTLAYSLNIPVIGVKEDKIKDKKQEAVKEDLKELSRVGLEKIKKARVGEYVIPFYGKAPNITKPKKK